MLRLRGPLRTLSDLGVRLGLEGHRPRGGADPFLRFDASFLGASTLLNTYVPEHGPPMVVAGTNTLRAGGGEMGQDEASGAGYATVTLGQPAAIIEAEFYYKSGPIGVMPTIAYATTLDISVGKTLHCRMGSSTSPGDQDQAFVQLGQPSGGSHGLKEASWYLKGSAYTPQAPFEKYKIRIEREDPWLSYKIFDKDNHLVSRQVIYDPRMGEHGGSGLHYFETHNPLYKFTRIRMWDKGDTVFDWGVPELNILRATDFLASAEGFDTAPFGGGLVSWANGRVSVSGTSYPNGGQLPLGPVASGKNVWTTVDFASLSKMDAGLVNTSGPVSNVEIASLNTDLLGRMQVLFSVGITEANARFVLLASSSGGGGAGSAEVDTFFAVYDPPTNFV